MSNKNKAVALEYKHGSQTAPKLTASGKEFLAEAIIKEAKKHNIPIHEDPQLVNILIQLSIDQQIPEALYLAVAEILAYFYNQNQTRQT